MKAGAIRAFITLTYDGTMRDTFFGRRRIIFSGYGSAWTIWNKKAVFLCNWGTRYFMSPAVKSYAVMLDAPTDHRT